MKYLARQWTPEQQDAVNTVQSMRALRELCKKPFPLAAVVGVPIPIPLVLPTVSSNSPDQEPQT